MEDKTFIVTLFTYVSAESEKAAEEIVKNECDYPILETRKIRKGEVGIPWDS